MKQYLFKLVQGGTQYNDSDTINRHIIFSNVIYLSLPIAYLIFMVFDVQQFFNLEWIDFFKFDRFVVPIIISLCLFCYYLNKKNFNVLSRVLFLLMWPVLLHILPIIIHRSPPDYYLAFPIGLIFHSVLIQIAFSAREEKIYFWTFIISNLILVLFSLPILVANDVVTNSENILKTDIYYRIDQIHYWLLFNLLIFYLIYVIEDAIGKLNRASAIIEKQQNDLKEKNNELESLIDFLALTNKALEYKVEDRTSELHNKNEQLIKYAHLNAHELRGAYARVRGLINLIDGSPDLEYDPEIRSRLKQSLDELDGVIRYIQKAVS